ncbi:MAG: site-2 protease family protein [Oscillospiraceae bacterium]|nr:site-2 protease family protein [Oscillospiraceae bacterium]
MYIAIAIIAFGILIGVHELGHFATAKLFKIKVNEFSLGMGPTIFKKQRGETLYSLRCLPIGGFCAIEGEDGDSEDDRAFTAKPIWMRTAVLLAGSLSNFIIGFIIALLLNIFVPYGTPPVITGFIDGFPLQGESGLMEGDRIVALGGRRVNTYNEFNLFLSLENNEPVDLTVKRDGRIIEYKDLPLILREYTDENGNPVTRYGLFFNSEKLDLPGMIKYSWYDCCYFVKLVRYSLGALLNGTAGIKDLSGPVGVVSAINDVGRQAAGLGAGLIQVFYFIAFIAVNLALMNMLPLPALDGGRIFFMFVFALIELIIRRRPDRRIEGYIHAAGLVLLLGLMAYVMLNDIIKLF